ncbi:MAG: glycoside hydrolase family 125 protein [Oscillospiraceae bacterium]|jgi:hypothetical protein|nr:glycoside hydrolase family 125 protein [Oscillospiraceae bacterium]
MSYHATGNEWLSLPTLREADGAIEGMTFLYMRAKGMIEARGGAGQPLFQPLLNAQPLEGLTWQRQGYWIPSFTAQRGDLLLRGMVLAPVGERAFVYRLQATNPTDRPISCRLGLSGCWGETLHEINETKPIDAPVQAYESGWNHRFVMELRLGLPLFALAPIAAEAVQSRFAQQGGQVKYHLWQDHTLAPGETCATDFFWGIGYDEVAAATSAKELLRHGYDALFARTLHWLNQRTRSIPDPRLNEIMNLNMFFSFFFASGKTLDTEELCLVTSRSPRYYVSAAYWDRDSLLWSFPAILMADAAYAREVLASVFTRQIKNVGIHSRFIDGTVLEPGFELDELCAPIIALKRYVDATGDMAFAQKPYVVEGVDRILALLAERKHPEIDLYETFLQPTDDTRVYPYLTYDNALVFRMLSDVDALYHRPACGAQALAVREAVFAHCVREHEGRDMFIWSTDLEGHWDIYDEPPGSLMLLAHYGFCDATDARYRNAVAAIRSSDYAYSFAGSPIAEIGCPHAPHPWILSICNSLLCGETESAARHLRLTQMDNGFACESVDENTGACATGAAFATCAGFLSYSLNEAFGGTKA